MDGQKPQVNDEGRSKKTVLSQSLTGWVGATQHATSRASERLRTEASVQLNTTKYYGRDHEKPGNPMLEERQQVRRMAQ